MPPFGRGNPDALLYRIVHQEPERGGVPADMRALVERCFAKDADARPSAAELLEQWTTAPMPATAWLPEEVATRIAAVTNGTAGPAVSGPAGPGPAGSGPFLAGPPADVAPVPAVTEQAAPDMSIAAARRIRAFQCFAMMS